MTSDRLHAGVVVVVVLCATALAAAGQIGAGELGYVFATALGFAAGRSGTAPSTTSERTTP